VLRISGKVSIPDAEIRITPIRASGPGGQKVNKVSSAVHLRFDIRASSLPEFYKQALLKMHDHRIGKDGVITIKAQEYRSRERNREAALARLQELVRSVANTRRKRIPTKVPRRVRKKRLECKAHRSRIKRLRGRITPD